MQHNYFIGKYNTTNINFVFILNLLKNYQRHENKELTQSCDEDAKYHYPPPSFNHKNGKYKIEIFPLKLKKH